MSGFWGPLYRERADTLEHTLRTVTEQDYPELEIIVSDNVSQDNTKDVIESFNDKRVRYTSTESRVGMSSNWEHGLSLVTGDYVMFLGDDDGLLPAACIDVAEIIRLTKTNALIWNKPNYSWPSVDRAPNKLSIDIHDDLIKMNGRILLWLIANGRTSYGRLPVLYSGFVRMDHIRRIKNHSGQFFSSVTPDVYSGIVLANELDSYLYSMRPFSLNGGSHHSNGLSNGSAEGAKLSNLFFTETDIKMNSMIRVIPGSIASCVAEAFLQAYDLGLTGGIKLNKNKHLRLIFSELSRASNHYRYHGMKIMEELDLPKDIRRLVISDRIKHNTQPSDSNTAIVKK